MDATFENGLARVDGGHKIHFINPDPTHLTVLCMPRSVHRTLQPVVSTDVTCERCIRIQRDRKGKK